MDFTVLGCVRVAAQIDIYLRMARSFGCLRGMLNLLWLLFFPLEVVGEQDDAAEGPSTAN